MASFLMQGSLHFANKKVFPDFFFRPAFKIVQDQDNTDLPDSRMTLSHPDWACIISSSPGLPARKQDPLII
jgi:hypothetical protein